MKDPFTGEKRVPVRKKRGVTIYFEDPEVKKL